MIRSGFHYLKYILNFTIGIIFCISAVLKILSLDEFELYIYSFKFLNLNLSYLAARIIISVELALGLGLILNFYPKLFRYSSIMLLCFFSGLLIYTLITRGNDDNCHCFGELIELNPLPSLIKNIAFIIILLLTKNVYPFKFRHKKILSVFVSIACLLSVFSISPPDNWSLNSHPEYNEAAFRQFLEEEDTINSLTPENQILCFFGLGCQYCELAAKKLHLIKQNNPQTKMDFIGIFWGSESKLESFREETGLYYSEISFIDPAPFLKITDGKMPLILILKNGNVEAAFNYRTLQEKSLIKTLTN